MDASIVELRRYLLHPNQRRVLIELFEEQFIESQEVLDIRVFGQFLDLDNADSFVWLRGFADMPGRSRGLVDFYGGPVWDRYRNQANATMIDSDNVLLVRTPSVQAQLVIPERDPGAESRTSGVVAAVIVPVVDAEQALEQFEREIAAAALSGGGTLLGYFITETSPNNFPRLPVREDVRVLLFLLGYADLASLDAAAPLLDQQARIVAEEGQTPEVLRLAPTRRSLLGGNSQPCALGARLRAATSEAPS